MNPWKDKTFFAFILGDIPRAQPAGNITQLARLTIIAIQKSLLKTWRSRLWDVDVPMTLLEWLILWYWGFRSITLNITSYHENSLDSKATKTMRVEEARSDVTKYEHSVLRWCIMGSQRQSGRGVPSATPHARRFPRTRTGLVSGKKLSKRRDSSSPSRAWERPHVSSINTATVIKRNGLWNTKGGSSDVRCWKSRQIYHFLKFA